MHPRPKWSARTSFAVALGIVATTTPMVLFIVQTDYSAGDEPLLYSCEYHLPDAFDFVVWRRGPAKLRAVRKNPDQDS